MNNQPGGQWPQQGQYQPPPPYYQPPQYGQSAPNAGQQAPYQPPTYYQPPMYYQQPPQYYGQPMQYAPPPVTYAPVAYLSPEQVSMQLFKTHCSRVGLMLMADEGIMAGVQILVMILGFVGYYLLRDAYFPWLDQQSAILNISMFAAAISPFFSHIIPAAAHGHKWGIKPLDPFRGDRLPAGFVLTATVTALGLNSLWGYIYYFCKNWVDRMIGPGMEMDQIYTPATMPLAGFFLMVFWTCIVAPVTEEYMFRGMILRTLSKHGAIFGIVMSALLFGLLHGNMAQTPMAFLIGLIMGYVAAKSGNIRQTIFMHMVNNTFAMLPQTVYYFAPQYEQYLDDATFAIDMIEIAFAFIALIWFAVKHHKGIKPRAYRLQTGSAAVSQDELDWAKMEIPTQRRTPEYNLVKSKFGQCLTSGGMIFFWVSMLLTIFITSILPHLMSPFMR